MKGTLMVGDYSDAYEQLKMAQHDIDELADDATPAECAAILRINFHRMYQGMMLALRSYEVANTSKDQQYRIDGGTFSWARAELDDFKRIEQQCTKLATIRPVSALKEECVKYLGRAKFYIEKIRADEARTNDYQIATVPDLSNRPSAAKENKAVIW